MTALPSDTRSSTEALNMLQHAAEADQSLRSSVFRAVQYRTH
jgi:hypothetical protein